MSDIATIRAIIQDQPVLVQESLVLDGTQTMQRTKYFPIVGSSVTVTGVAVPSSIDEQSGALTWAAAPSIGSYLAKYSFVQLLDTTLQAFIDLFVNDDWEAGDSDMLRLAAAMALDAIASSQALILKRIEMLDLKTDGPAVAKALREHAATLREQVFDSVEAAFDIIEQINDTPGYREKVLKDALREGES